MENALPLAQAPLAAFRFYRLPSAGVCKSTDTHKRLRTSILIQINGLTLTVDCGPDFRQQMLREDVRNLICNFNDPPEDNIIVDWMMCGLLTL